MKTKGLVLKDKALNIVYGLNLFFILLCVLPLIFVFVLQLFMNSDLKETKKDYDADKKIHVERVGPGMFEGIDVRQRKWEASINSRYNIVTSVLEQYKGTNKADGFFFHVLRDRESGIKDLAMSELCSRSWLYCYIAWITRYAVSYFFITLILALCFHALMIEIFIKCFGIPREILESPPRH